MSRFEGASAVVTGASRGLGLAIARRLADRGARLVICARDGEALSKAAWQLRNAGAVVHPVRCDVTDEDAAPRLLAEAEHQHGGLDLLVNNAGEIQVGPLSAMRESDFRDAMETMYFAPPREYAWFAAAAGLPLLSMDADRAARAVVRAAERRRPEVILGASAHVVVRLHGLAPATATRAATVAARVLDQAASADQGQAHIGKDAARRLDSRLLGALTALNDRAARRLNQVR